MANDAGRDQALFGNAFFQRLTVPAGETERLFDSFTVGLADRDDRRFDSDVDLSVAGYLLSVDRVTGLATVLNTEPSLVGFNTDDPNRFQEVAFAPRANGAFIAAAPALDYAFLVTLAGVAQARPADASPDSVNYNSNASTLSIDEEVFGESRTFSLTAEDLVFGSSFLIDGADLVEVRTNLDLASKVTLVPEPASLALLSIGGLLLLRRRA